MFAWPSWQVLQITFDNQVDINYFQRFFNRKWPKEYDEIDGAYQDELKGLSRYFRMEDEYPDLYQSWQEMIEKLYHEEQPYFCTVRQGHFKGGQKILAKNFYYLLN